MSPKKTIYIKPSDEEMWIQAERLCGGSLSAFIADAVRQYIKARNFVSLVLSNANLTNREQGLKKGGSHGTVQR